MLETGGCFLFCSGKNCLSLCKSSLLSKCPECVPFELQPTEGGRNLNMITTLPLTTCTSKYKTRPRNDNVTYSLLSKWLLSFGNVLEQENNWCLQSYLVCKGDFQIKHVKAHSYHWGHLGHVLSVLNVPTCHPDTIWQPPNFHRCIGTDIILQVLTSNKPPELPKRDLSVSRILATTLDRFQTVWLFDKMLSIRQRLHSHLYNQQYLLS